MEIILFRHGIAEEPEDFVKTGKEDYLRPLTIKGRKKTLKVTEGLKKFNKSIDLIVTSPLVRAKQTAEIIQKVYSEVEIVEASELVPGSPSSAFLKWLRMRVKGRQRIVVVGHEPHLSTFCSWLLCGKEESFVELKKGGICCLSFESFEELKPGVTTIQYLITPKMIEEL